MIIDPLALGNRILSHAKIAASVFNILDIAENASGKNDAHKTESNVRQELTSLGRNVLQSWAAARESECSANVKETYPDARRHSKKNSNGIQLMAMLA